LGLGEEDAAYEWLERAVEVHDAQIPWLKFEPPYSNLRGKPRFSALLRRAGLPE